LSNSSTSSSPSSPSNSLPKNLEEYIKERIDPNNPHAATHLNNIKKSIRAYRNALKGTKKKAANHNDSDRPVTREAKNTSPQFEEKGRNRAKLAHMDEISRQYMYTISDEIYKQLREIQAVIFKLNFNNQYIGKPVSAQHRGKTIYEFTERNSHALEQVAQSLRDALHLILYPKMEYPNIHHSPKKFAYNQETYGVFITPILEKIDKQQKKILDDQMKLSARQPSNFNKYDSYKNKGMKQRMINYEERQKVVLPIVEQQLQDVRAMLPHMSK
jgi:hypothetical protein